MLKRKREAGDVDSSSIAKVAPGTVVYPTGKAVKAGLAGGSRQAFTQQILTPHSKLPLPLNSPAVVILQQYLDLSAVCEEVFDAWNEGDKRRDEKQVEAAVYLLAQLIRILTPLPFFRGSVVGLVNKLIAPQERYHDLLNRLVSSNSRDGMLAGLSLAAAAVNVEKPDPTSSTASASSGRLATKVWAVLLDGGSVRGLGKQLGMRRRRKDGSAIYDEADPLDKPDIRHLVLDIILPLVSTYAFHSHARALLRPLYSNLEQDPPITILRILTALWEAITGPSPGQGRKTALVLLDESALGHLVELFNREQTEPSSGRSVAEMAQAFVEGVTSKPGRGVCFTDEGWYPRKPKESALARLGMDDDDDREMHLSLEDRMRRGLHNRILSNVVRKLGGKVVDDNGRVGEWAIKVFEACPELVAGYWPNSALAVDPKLNARWIATMAYISSIVSLPCPDISTFRQPLPKGSTLELPPFRPQPPAISTMIESILPSPLTKTHMTKGLSHPDHLVQLVTAQTLARCLQKLSRTRDLLRSIEAEVTRGPGSSEENPWSVCIRQLEMEARRRVPELMVVIAFAQKSAIMGQVAEDEEVDEALASKSAMLTEAALRLFGLYHQAIPAVTRDTKFDVGRLLVSSSSVKQERRERKDANANAGSVADETMSQGSVGSMGSAGTAGMGGGFGYAKGDVKGFEALSQVHVLQLLGSVKGWQWINKASGSQYTYLYHILQLHLASHHPSTILHTTALIRHLLLPTPLFDHDPSELDLWLSCLPRLPTGSGALGIIQQVHFLSFFDDCVRRCVKLPYRYVDEVTATVPGYFNPQHLHTFPSILLMTMVEQWCAKVAGSHMSSEAAGVVAHVVGRILLGLVGKMRDMVFVTAVLGRMQGTLDAMRKEGKAKEGLEQLLQGIAGDLGKVDQTVQAVDGQDQPKLLAELLDERKWRTTSFEYIASHLNGVDDGANDKMISLIMSVPPGSQARCARFAAQLLASRTDESRRRFLALIKLAIETCANTTEAHRAKEAVLDSAWIKRALTSTDGDVLRTDIDALVGVLDETNKDDQAVAEEYVIALEKGIVTDKKGKRLIGTLDLTTPWARFFSPQRASSVITKLGQHADRLHGTRKGKSVELGPRVMETISTLIGQCADPRVALADLGLWADIGVLEPVATVVRRATVNSAAAPAAIKVTPDTLQKLLMSSSTSTGKLIEALVLAYPSAALAFANLVQDRADVIAGRTELVPAIRAVLDLPGSIDLAKSGSVIADIAQMVIGSTTSSDLEAATAVDVLEVLIRAQAFSAVPITTFTINHARLAERLAARGEQTIVRTLLEEGLKAAISFCATTVALEDVQIALLSALVSAVKALSLEQVNLDGMLVESVISAITQDRLTAEEPVLLAAALIQRCDIKASFVRQQLSLLSSVSYYNTLCAPSCTPSTRLPFVRLYSALFHSSTYTSCQPNFVEPLLPLYAGSLHIADRLILDMWQTFESVRHLSVTSILRNWSANGLSGLTGAGKALDALVSLDSGRVMATCVNFPLRRTLAVQDQDRPQEPTPYGQTKQVKVKTTEPWGEQEEKGYDPVFVLNLLGGVLAASEVPPGKEQGEEEQYEEAESEETQYQLSGLDWVEIIRSDTLGVAVCALASRDAEMRRLAGHVLSRVMAQIQDVTFHERDQLLYVLTLLQHAVPDPASATTTDNTSTSESSGANGFVRSWDGPTPSAPSVPAPPRLPTMTTLFLAYHLHSLGSPSHFLYPITSRFLLQRPVLDLYDPPMLYALLYGSDRGPRGELPSMQEVRRGRGWIVRLIRDGTRSEVDWSICRRRNVWALLSSMFRISVDINFRRLVLQTMESMALVPQAARTLVHKYCIFPWAKLQYELSFKETNRASAEERERYVKLVELCARGCVDGEVRKAKAKAAAAATAASAQGLGSSAGTTAHSQAAAGALTTFDSDNGEGDSDAESDSDSDSESESDSGKGRLVDPLANADEDDQDPLMPTKSIEEGEAGMGGDQGAGGEDPVLALCKVLTPRPDWLVDIEAFIDTVLGDAEMPRLAALSRILLRVSVLPQAKETIAYSLPRIVDRLVAISSGKSVLSTSAPVQTDNKANPSSIEQEVVENLFRAGLAMGDGDAPVAKIGLGVDVAHTRKALGELIERVKRLDGEVGDWVRREVRIAEWDALRN